MSRTRPGQHPAGRRSAGQAPELRGHPRASWARTSSRPTRRGRRWSSCSKNDVAVVLVDVCMPELDGFELASMLREHPRYEKTAIIFISAIHLSDLDRMRGYETGAVDYVPVPVVPEILRAKVKIFAELCRKTRQLERLNDELERRVRERTAELEEFDRPAARDRRAAAPCERGCWVRDLRLQCRRWSVLLVPVSAAIVGIAG